MTDSYAKNLTGRRAAPWKKPLRLCLTLGLAIGGMGIAPITVEREAKPILVLLPTAKDGGVSLEEVMEPSQRFVQAGFLPVFVSEASAVSIKRSKQSDFYSLYPEKFLKHQQLCRSLGFCQKNGNAKALVLGEVLKSGLEPYVALFIPSMIGTGVDPFGVIRAQVENSTVGALFHHFHERAKPIGLSGNAPMLLLASLPTAGDYLRLLMTRGKKPATDALALAREGFVFSNYAVTVARDQVGPLVPGVSLEETGVKVLHRVRSRAPNVIVDKELVTGENPMSLPQLTDEVLKKINDFKSVKTH